MAWERGGSVWAGARPNRPHKYGYALLNEAGEVAQVIDRTNPNRHWDWYQLGGRWTGFFQLKPSGRLKDGRIGTPGLMTPQAAPGTADQALKADIDFNSMRLMAEAEAGKRWDDAHAVIAGREFRSWEQVREDHGEDINAARDAYHRQQPVIDLREQLRVWEPDEYLASREAYTTEARLKAGVTFAVVKDGQWYERGSMGWFGCVHGEKDQTAWHAEFAKLLDGLPDDTLLSMYDCHI